MDHPDPLDPLLGLHTLVLERLCLDGYVYRGMAGINPDGTYWGSVTRRPCTRRDLLDQGLPVDFFGYDVEQPRITEVVDGDDLIVEPLPPAPPAVGVLPPPPPTPLGVGPSNTIPSVPNSGVAYPTGYALHHPPPGFPPRASTSSSPDEPGPEAEIYLFDSDEEVQFPDTDTASVPTSDGREPVAIATSGGPSARRSEEGKRKRNFRKRVKRRQRRALKRAAAAESHHTASPPPSGAAPPPGLPLFCPEDHPESLGPPAPLLEPEPQPGPSGYINPNPPIPDIGREGTDSSDEESVEVEISSRDVGDIHPAPVRCDTPPEGSNFGPSPPPALHRYCFMCDSRVADGKLRRHIEQTHLPWWLVLGCVCWRCRRREPTPTLLRTKHSWRCSPAPMIDADALEWARLCNGLLRLLRREWGCRSNAELLRLVVNRCWFPQETSPYHLDVLQRLTFQLWEELNGRIPLPSLSSYSIQPPSEVACLLHPKVLACVLSHVGSRTLRAITQLQYLELACDAPSLPLPLYPVTVDSHIHVDAWGSRFVERLGSAMDCPLRYLYLIGNYVFPRRWAQWDAVRGHELLYSTFGIHPNLCSSSGVVSTHRAELVQRLLAKRCVGLGEIGLDYFRIPRGAGRFHQRSQFEELLRLRPDHLPVVIHCRGEGALDDCLEILRQQLRPPTVAVQVHCFLGDDSQVRRWIQAVPNVVFSLGPRSLSLTGDEAVEMKLILV